MNTTHNQRLSDALEALKEEVLAELDRRIRASEQDTNAYVEAQITEKIEDTVSEQVVQQLQQATRIDREVLEMFYNFQESLQVRYRGIYAVLVFAGFVVFWYGAWRVIATVPILSNGYVAMGVGLFLLAIPGAVYKKLAG